MWCGTMLTSYMHLAIKKDFFFEVIARGPNPDQDCLVLAIYKCTMSHDIYNLQVTKYNWCNKGEENVERRYEGQQVTSSGAL